MKRSLALLFLPAWLWGGFYLIDGSAKTALAEISAPAQTPETMAQLPRIQRHDPTITLLYEGEEYNHRHLNVRLATLETHPAYTVLTERSETIAPDSYRITFDGYCYYGARMLQVYYEGQWYGALLEPLQQ